jgi:hypothetical protein
LPEATETLLRAVREPTDTNGEQLLREARG